MFYDFRELKEFCSEHFPENEYIYTYPAENIKRDSEMMYIECTPVSVGGGKGGFGSELRRTRVPLKTSNKDACRTLDGERVGVKRRREEKEKQARLEAEEKKKEKKRQEEEIKKLQSAKLEDEKTRTETLQNMLKHDKESQETKKTEAIVSSVTPDEEAKNMLDSLF